MVLCVCIYERPANEVRLFAGGHMCACIHVNACEWGEMTKVARESLERERERKEGERLGDGQAAQRV